MQGRIQGGLEGGGEKLIKSKAARFDFSRTGSDILHIKVLNAISIFPGGLKMSKGLKTCATIWTAVLGIGSFVGACILWSNADGGYYYNTDYDDSKIEVQEDQYAVRPAMWISLEP